MDEHDRVGPDRAADVLVGAELVLLVDRQPGPRVRAEEEVVARVLRASARGRGRRAARDRLGECTGVDADVPQLHPPERARGSDDADDQGERRGNGDHDTDQPPGGGSGIHHVPSSVSVAEDAATADLCRSHGELVAVAATGPVPRPVPGRADVR